MIAGKHWNQMHGQGRIDIIKITIHFCICYAQVGSSFEGIFENIIEFWDRQDSNISD